MLFFLSVLVPLWREEKSFATKSTKFTTKELLYTWLYVVAEKHSIVFYLGLKDFVPDQLGKNKLDIIIKAEKGHIRILSKELISLNE